MLRKIGWSFAAFAVLLALIPVLYRWYVPTREARDLETYKIIDASLRNDDGSPPDHTVFVCAKPYPYVDVWLQSPVSHQIWPKMALTWRDKVALDAGLVTGKFSFVSTATPWMTFEFWSNQSEDGFFDRPDLLPSFARLTTTCSTDDPAVKRQLALKGKVSIAHFSKAAFNHSRTKALILNVGIHLYPSPSGGYLKGCYTSYDKRDGRWIRTALGSCRVS
jgi:hypothetical protein